MGYNYNENMVNTNLGMVSIEDLKQGDSILIYNNSFNIIKHIYKKSISYFYELNCMASPTCYILDSSFLYVRQRYRVWDTTSKRHKRLFRDPEWLNISNLSKDYYIGTPINTIEEPYIWEGVKVKSPFGHSTVIKNELSKYMNNKQFWWLVGRFIGDGWVDRWNIDTGGIKICSANTKTKTVIALENCLKDLGIGYNVTHTRTATRLCIPKQEYKEFFRQFGNGAKNKIIPQKVLNLPKDLLQSLLEGYWSADGSFSETNKVFQATSVSKALILSLSQAIHKVYNRPTSIQFFKRPSQTYIEGRLVNQNDTYTIRFKKESSKQDKAFYENGYIWSPIKSITKIEDKKDILNFELENSNFYIMQNILMCNNE